jgi:hypothetical protein
MTRDEQLLAVAAWADRYAVRVERDIANAWPDLEGRVVACLDALGWRELMFGRRERFARDVLGPAVAAWAERHVTPLVEDAQRDLQQILAAAGTRLDLGGPALPDVGGGLTAGDVLAGGALPAGVGLGAAAAAVAITKLNLLFVTIFLVSWPLLIAGFVAGGLLATFGVMRLATLRSALVGRVREHVLPRLRDAVLKDAADGEEPSLKARLQQQIREAAAAARKLILDREERA